VIGASDKSLERFHNYNRIIRLVVPVVLANASAPLLGLADTAVIGHTGGAVELGAIAMASLVFSFVYWGFGFLRMGTTGFVAQAYGAGDSKELQAVVLRSMMLGLVLGVLLIAFQVWIAGLALWLMDTGKDIKRLVSTYFYVRVWGAPATLITYALLGVLVGMGWMKKLLWVQFFLNGLNILLNVVFVLGFGLSVKGVALGTLIAEWCTLLFAFCLVMKSLSWEPMRQVRKLTVHFMDQKKITALFRVNMDIMVRTLFLLAGFGWFANQGAGFGPHVLAANHVLLQFVSFSAFFLDGYAYVMEMSSGTAYGMQDKRLFLRELKDTSVLAGITAVLLAVGIGSMAPFIVPLLTDAAEVIDTAVHYAPYASVYVLCSFVAFQLDGVFIGMTKSSEMRNASILSFLVFLSLGKWLGPLYGNNGLWVAFIAFVVMRAVSLCAYFPRLMRSFSGLAAA